MTKLTDLKGIKFGNLLVIKRTEDYVSPKNARKTKWLCRCDCGRSDDFKVRAAHLTSGFSTSCKICHDEKVGGNNFEDLTGRTFGNLKVIERGEDYIYKNKKIRVRWLCNCTCGSSNILIYAYSLKIAKDISCEKCRVKKRGLLNRLDLTGKTFGFLRAIEINNMKRGAYWLCYCDPSLGGCGNYTVSALGNLRGGHSTSCGCRTESSIALELKKYCIKYYKADKKENREFINPHTGYALPFDIYIPNGRVFIEIHGRQHYILNGWHYLAAKKNGTTPEEELEYQKKKDRMKRKFARKNGTYIEVDLRKIKTTEDAIEYVENKLRILL